MGAKEEHSDLEELHVQRLGSVGWRPVWLE